MGSHVTLGQVDWKPILKSTIEEVVREMQAEKKPDGGIRIEDEALAKRVLDIMSDGHGKYIIPDSSVPREGGFEMLSTADGNTWLGKESHMDLVHVVLCVREKKDAEGAVVREAGILKDLGLRVGTATRETILEEFHSEITGAALKYEDVEVMVARPFVKA